MEAVDKETPDNSGKVTFTVKELLQDIARNVNDVRAELSKKADASVMQGIAVKVEVLEGKVITLEAQRNTKQRLESLWFPILASVLVGLILGGISVYALIK